DTVSIFVLACCMRGTVIVQACSYIYWHLLVERTDLLGAGLGGRGQAARIPFGKPQAVLSAAGCTSDDEVVRGISMLRRLVRAMRCLKDDERGAILIYFTLALLPLVAVGGAAMDLGHVFLVKQRLTNAVDSASLALGARNNLTDQQATDLVTAFIRTRYSGTL